MRYRYEVYGMGSFPEDMLRYDRAKVISTRPREGGRPGSLIYTIEGECKPTIGRWQSFIWNVSNVERV